MSSVTILPSQASGSRPVAMAGMPVGTLFRFWDLLNSDPEAAQVTTSTISAVNDAVYTISIGGVTVSYTADGSATTQEINDGLKAAFDASAELGAYATYAQTAAATYTLTGIRPGESFTVTVDANQSLAATTAAASANPLPFGRFVARTGYDSDLGVETCGLPKASDFTAQVDTWTLTYEAGIVTSLQVVWNGQTYEASTAMATDADTTAAALAALINAELNHGVN